MNGIIAQTTKAFSNAQSLIAQQIENLTASVTTNTSSITTLQASTLQRFIVGGVAHNTGPGVNLDSSLQFTPGSGGAPGTLAAVGGDGGGGSYLPLSGGEITGNLIIDGTTQVQTMSNGDNSSNAASTAFVQNTIVGLSGTGSVNVVGGTDIGVTNDGPGNFIVSYTGPATAGLTSLWSPGAPTLSTWTPTPNLQSYTSGVDIQYQFGGFQTLGDNIEVTITGSTTGSYVWGSVGFNPNGGNTVDIIQSKAIRIPSGTQPTVSFDSTPTSGNLLVSILVGGSGNVDSNSLVGFSSDNQHSDDGQGMSTGKLLSDGSTNSFELSYAADEDMTLLIVEATHTTSINCTYQHYSTDISNFEITGIQTPDGNAGPVIFFGEWNSNGVGSFIPDAYTSLLYSTPSGTTGSKYALFGLANLPTTVAGPGAYQAFALQVIPSGSTQPAVVQQQTYRVPASSGSTFSFAMPATSGNLVVAILLGGSDVASNTISHLSSFYNNDGNGLGIHIGQWVADGTTNSFSLGSSVSDPASVILLEISHTNDLNVQDYSSSGSGTDPIDLGTVYTFDTVSGISVYGALWYTNNNTNGIYTGGVNSYNTVDNIYETPSGTSGGYYAAFGIYELTLPETFTPSVNVTQNGSVSASIYVPAQTESPLQWAGYYTGVPGEPYSIVFGLSMIGDLPTGGSGIVAGGIFALGWCDNSNEYFYMVFYQNGTYALYTANGTTVHNPTSLTGGVMSPVSQLSIDFSKYSLLILTDDGTNLSFILSVDGVSGSTLFSVPKSSLPLSSPYNVFLGVGALDGSTSGNTWINLFLYDPNGSGRSPQAPGY